MGRLRKYTFNENYFENIDSQEKAYFLGFMYADGCVAKKQNFSRITLQERDKEILEKFKILLNYKGSLHYSKRYKALRLSLFSSKMKQDLIKNGCIPQKTFKLTFPNWLREDLKRHFIRGYFDGDGCVSLIKGNRFRAAIGAREEFLKVILELSKIRGYIHKYSSQRIWYLRYFGSSAISFLTWLYKDATIYLERKHQKFLDYLENKGGR